MKADEEQRGRKGEGERERMRNGQANPRVSTIDGTRAYAGSYAKHGELYPPTNNYSPLPLAGEGQGARGRSAKNAK